MGEGQSLLLHTCPIATELWLLGGGWALGLQECGESWPGAEKLLLQPTGQPAWDPGSSSLGYLSFTS